MSRALLLVDHGSRRPEANALLDAVATALRARAEVGTIIRTAHLEIAEPDIATGIAACIGDGADEVVLLPFFLGPGRHTTIDIPEQVESAARKHPSVRLRVSAPLGPHDALVDILLERAERALRD